MKEKLFTLKTVSLHNNCPECYGNNSLELTFKQKLKENALYKSITQEISEELNCSKCESFISPSLWTDDIERVIDYHKKLLDPKPKSLKLKKIAWILLVCIDLTILVVILYSLDIFTF